MKTRLLRRLRRAAAKKFPEHLRMYYRHTGCLAYLEREYILLRAAELKRKRKMTYQEMDAAVREAEAVVRRAESYRYKMARFLCGRLRGIDADVLRELKKELRKFNAQTGEWNEK